MAKAAAYEAGRLWLPGFDPNDVVEACPDLFAATVQQQPQLQQEAPVANTQTQRRVWRPHELPRNTAAQVPRPLWPVWDDEHLAGLEGPVAKFEANLQAIAALQRHVSTNKPDAAPAAAPLDADRRAMLRYTGWGGLPQAFNFHGRDAAWA